MSRYTPPQEGRAKPQGPRRPRWVRISVWACLIGAAALVLVDLFAALIR